MSDHKKRPLVTMSEDNFSRCHCHICKLEDDNELLRAALQKAIESTHRGGEEIGKNCPKVWWCFDAHKLLARGEEASSDCRCPDHPCWDCSHDNCREETK